MELPTKTIVYKSNRERVRINAADFDHNLHEEINETISTPIEVETESTPVTISDGENTDKDLTPGNISTVVSDTAIALIHEAKTIEELDKLEIDEKNSQRHPGGRKKVLAAIEAARSTLIQ